MGVRLVTEMGGNAGDSGDMPVFIHRNLPPPAKREWEQRGQNRPMSGPLLALLVPSVPSIEEWSGDGRNPPFVRLSPLSPVFHANQCESEPHASRMEDLTAYTRMLPTSGSRHFFVKWGGCVSKKPRASRAFNTVRWSNP